MEFIAIDLPKRLVEEAKKRGLDLEAELVEYLSKRLALNPEEEAVIRLQLAKRFLKEGEAYVGKDPVQASEKLYKASEECIKALTLYYNVREVLAKVEERGRWTVTELEKAVLATSRKLGKWLREAWDTAWALHVWGFHEAKFDVEDVEERMPYVEKMINEAAKLIMRS